MLTIVARPRVRIVGSTACAVRRPTAETAADTVTEELLVVAAVLSHLAFGAVVLEEYAALFYFSATVIDAYQAESYNSIERLSALATARQAFSTHSSIVCRRVSKVRLSAMLAVPREFDRKVGTTHRAKLVWPSRVLLDSGTRSSNLGETQMTYKPVIGLSGVQNASFPFCRTTVRYRAKLQGAWLVEAQGKGR